jgi:deoxyribodipyrimidine photolyase
MERRLAVAGNQQLAAAQVRASSQGVPFAVLTYVSEAELHTSPKIQQLQAVEADLARHHIPLITLVGDAQKVLSGAIYHLKPLAVFLEQTPVGTQERLQTHPYPWPGTVIPVAKLQTINTTCS